MCEEGEKIQRATEGSKSLLSFSCPLAVLIKMLMDLYCVCIYFGNYDAGKKALSSSTSSPGYLLG